MPGFIDSLYEYFDEGAVERGLRYAASGHPILLDVTRDGDEVRITALCKGSAPSPYSVHVTAIVGPEMVEDIVDQDCSCPLGAGCKHTVAVLAAALGERGAATARPRPEVTSAFGITAPNRPKPPPRALDYALEDWLRRATGRRRRPRDGDDEETFYIIEPDRRAVAPQHARRRKDGKFGRSARVDVHSHHFELDHDPPRYADAADVLIARLLRSMQQAQWRMHGDQDAYALFGPVGALALQKILATGRAYLGSATARLTEGAPRAGRFLWQTNGDTLTLVAACDQGEVVALPTSPLMYIDTQSAEAGVLEMPESAERYYPLIELPPIEREGREAFFSHWRGLQADRKVQIALPDPPPEVAAVAPPAPRLILNIRPVKFSVYGPGRQKVEMRYAGIPVARYGDDQFPLTGDPPLVSLIDAGGNTYRRVARNVAAERAACDTLGRLGLRNQGWIGARPSDGTVWMLEDSSDTAWRRGFARLAAGANAAGIELDIDAAFPIKMRDIELLDGALAPAGEAGWFELDLGIELDGKRLSIAKPLAEWLRRQPEPLRFLRSPAHDFVLLDLPDGTLVRLPRERVRALLEPLLEFGEPALAADGKLRMSRLDAALHPQWVAAARRFGEDLKSLRGRLLQSQTPAALDPAPGFKATLRPYQKVGLAWLAFLDEHGFGAILADDMGLGKTVQVLAHVHRKQASAGARVPVLIVAPTSVLPNWQDEIARFAPKLSVLTLHGKQRAERYDAIARSDIVLTTYALLARDGDKLAAQRYRALILDEGQFVKNPATRTREVAAQIAAEQRIVLTGTPLENNLGELWSLVDLAQPGLLGTLNQFTARVRNPIEKEGDTDQLAALRRRIRPFFLRRQRSEVLDELPPKTEVVRHVELEGAQRDLYETIRLALDDELRKVIAERGLARSQIAVLDALLKLRQACCDPRLVKRPEAARAHGESAKLTLLTAMLDELAAEKRKVLVFSQFASMIDLIEAELAGRGLTCAKLIGATEIDARSESVRRFQAGEIDVFLISLRAGGTGVNLTAADTVIHFDPWWNPAVEAQATARAHRMGQERPVLVYKLIARGTVEERILELLGRKRALADAVLAGGATKGAPITEEDIAALLAPL